MLKQFSTAARPKVKKQEIDRTIVNVCLSAHVGRRFVCVHTVTVFACGAPPVVCVCVSMYDVQLKYVDTI